MEALNDSTLVSGRCFFVTRDAGASWQSKYSAETLCADGEGGAYRTGDSLNYSSDGGATWRSISEFGRARVNRFIRNRGRVYAAVEDRGVWRTVSGSSIVLQHDSTGETSRWIDEVDGHYFVTTPAYASVRIFDVAGRLEWNSETFGRTELPLGGRAGAHIITMRCGSLSKWQLVITE